MLFVGVDWGGGEGKGRCVGRVRGMTCLSMLCFF